MSPRRPSDPAPAAPESDEAIAARIAAAGPAELAELAADPRAGVRRRVAAHPSTPPAALARLAEDGNLWVRSDAAANPSTPAEALDRLRRAGSGPGLAGPAPPDPTLDPAVLAELATGGEWARRLAARHPATPPAALARLAIDPVPAIRAAAAGHPSRAGADSAAYGCRSVPALETLLAAVAEAPPDSDLPLAVALALAGHPEAPPPLLARLAEHGAMAVRAAVAGRSDLDSERLDLLLRAGSSPDLTGFVPPDPDLPAADLARLARGGGWARLLAARHPATDPADLARLAADADPLVRGEAIRHSTCPEPVRELLRRAGGDADSLLGPVGATDREGTEDLTEDDLQRLRALGPWGRTLADRLG